MDITKSQYEYALDRVEQLLPLVTDETPASDKNAVELAIRRTDKAVSPSRVSDYISGRAEPTLRIARALCLTLGIAPAAILGL